MTEYSAQSTEVHRSRYRYLCTDQQSHQIKMQESPRGSIADRGVFTATVHELDHVQ
jgi:hypothetical protein